MSKLYNVTAVAVTEAGLTVTIPVTGGGPQGPTGQVNNNASAFLVNGVKSNFIFANLNRTISAWNGSAGTSAQIKTTTPGAVYTGLAIGSNASGPMLYAVNAASGQIDVFNDAYAPVNLGVGAFVNSNASLAGLVPFNVKNINVDIYVTYAPPGRAVQIAAGEGSWSSGRF